MAVSSANPFMIDVAQPNLEPVLQGIGGLIKGARESADKERVSKGLMEAYTSNNPDAVAGFLADNPEAGATLSAMLGHRNQTTEKNYADSVFNLATNTNLDDRAKILADRIYAVDEQGGDSTESQMALSQLTQDPQGFERALELEVARTQPKDVLETYQMRMGLKEPDKKFLEEERKYAYQAVNKFDTDSREMIQTVEKMAKLKEQASGTGASARAARISMIANIVRLNSPGIVSESELQTYTGGQSLTQGLLQLMNTGKVDKQAIESYIDAAGGQFDEEGMERLGRTLASSKAGGLAKQYEGARDRATTAKMSQRAYQSNFGKNEYYNDVKALQHSVPQDAIAYLLANPDSAVQFEEKFGYLPEGL